MVGGLLKGLDLTGDPNPHSFSCISSVAITSARLPWVGSATCAVATGGSDNKMAIACMPDAREAGGAVV